MLLVLDWSDLGAPELCRRIRATVSGERCVVLAAGLNERPQALESALEAIADFTEQFSWEQAADEQAADEDRG